MPMSDDLNRCWEALARALVGAPSVCWWGPRAFDTYTAATTAPWPVGGGVYIFARGRAGGRRAIYVGETECFETRLASHERWLDALGFGATEIHVWAMPGATKAERLDLERDLRERYQPVLNPLPQRLPSWQSLGEVIQRERANALSPWARHLV
ncbi:MAG: hypothetical protein OXG35_26095 [Acidobacteria bacterium]|nr:hypothetical protein [Acidobacteriota bacterium]